jgi:serine/threonine-protein kinase SRPK3
MFDNLTGIGCDIWAFACTLYEIRSRRMIFETYDGTDDDVLSYIVRLLGKLPEPWWSAWEARSRRFDEDGKPTGEETFTFQDLLEDSVQFRIGDKNGRLVDIAVPPEERNLLADLLLRMLKYDPTERATIDSVMDHPWFNLN